MVNEATEITELQNQGHALIAREMHLDFKNSSKSTIFAARKHRKKLERQTFIF